jgi:hypothetical protein
MRLRALLVTTLVTPVLVLLGGPAHATTTFTVTGLTDPSPTPACGGTVCPSLRAAVAAANASPGSVIQLGSGTFQLSQGELTLAASMSIEGAGEGATTIKQVGIGRLFETTNAASTFDLSNMTLSGGNVHATAAAPWDALGGAIYNNGSSMTLTKVVLAGNTASGVDPGNSSSVQDATGAAIASLGALTLVSSAARDNTAVGSTVGGTIEIFAGSLDIRDSTFSGNEVTARGNGFGGALMLDGGTTATIRSSTFVGNQATGGSSGLGVGGAIWSDDATSLAVVNSTFTGNVAEAATGGSASGGAVDSTYTASLSLASDTFSGNSVAGSATSTGGNVNIDGDNTTTVTIGDTIITGGTSSGTGSNCSLHGTVNDAGDNLEDTATSQCGLQSSAGDLIGVSPQLGPLASNGGPTQTMLPSVASPAVGAGGACSDPSAIPVGPLLVDQRGAPRPSGGPCDIGAVESEVPLNATPPSITPGSPVPGQTATCDHGTFGGGEPLTYDYAWTSNNALVGTDASTYQVSAGDLGHALRCTVVAHGADFSSVPVTSAPVTVTLLPPVLSSLRQSHAIWRLPSRFGSPVPVGTTFRFGLTERSMVTMTFKQVIQRRRVSGRCVALTPANRSRPACSTLYVLRGQLTRPGAVGGNAIAFRGLVDAGGYLRPGRYLVTVAARNAVGKVSTPASLRFTIVVG